jgi:peptidoglycan/LPS O-acetylase OafA/YrhL
MPHDIRMVDENPTRRMIDPLTSLRFFAAMAVVVFHSGSSWVATHSAAPAPFVSLLKNGYLGVTFFFVLSGFVLQHVYRGGLSWPAARSRYVRARFARIYPLYLLAFLMIIPFSFEATWRAVPQLFLLQRWTITTVVPLSNWNMPAWTLSVELLFYALFPLLSAYALRASTAARSMWLVAICAIELLSGCSSVMSNALVPAPWMEWVPVPLLRLPEFFLGVLVAEAVNRGQGTKMTIPALPVAILLVAVLAATTSPMIAGAATILSALLIYSCAVDKRSAFVRCLSWQPFVYLGGASYAIYLLQEPVHLSIERVGAPLLLFYPVLLIVSCLVFTCYEEPMRRLIRAIPTAPLRNRKLADAVGSDRSLPVASGAARGG